MPPNPARRLHEKNSFFQKLRRWSKNEFTSLSNKSFPKRKPVWEWLVPKTNSKSNEQEEFTMKVKEITVSVSQKVNTGNYSSKGFGLSATAALSEQDNLLKTKQQLTDSLSKMLDFEISKIKVGGFK